MRHANTLLLTVQQLSASWGVALGAIALRVGDPVARLFGGAAGTHAAYTVAFILVACLALLATAEALRMHPSSGDASARRPCARGRAAARRALTTKARGSIELWSRSAYQVKRRCSW